VSSKVLMTVYGRKQICASCVGAPGSKETYEWLQAAIKRKYDADQLKYEYVDMDKIENNEKHQKMIEQIMEEDLFYPLIVVEDEIVAEGIPRLRSIFEAIEKAGVKRII